MIKEQKGKRSGDGSFIILGMAWPFSSHGFSCPLDTGKWQMILQAPIGSYWKIRAELGSLESEPEPKVARRTDDLSRKHTEPPVR